MVMIETHGLKYSMDGYYKKLLDDLKNAVEKHDMSIVIIFDGKSGRGKTTMANQTAASLDPNYSLSNLYYNPEAFLMGLSEAKPGTFILFDEAMLISSRSALSKRNQMIIQAMSMIRSKRIYVGFCVNSIFDLDKNLAMFRADVLVHVYGEGLTDRGRFVCFFKSRDDKYDRLKWLFLLGKKYYDYGKPQGNFYGSFTKQFVLDEKEYERRKQIAINIFLRSGIHGSSHERQLTDDMVIKMREQGITIKDICEVGDFSKQTFHNIVRRKKEQKLSEWKE